MKKQIKGQESIESLKNKAGKSNFPTLYCPQNIVTCIPTHKLVSMNCIVDLKST
jgi:hypothetical protein